MRVHHCGAVLLLAACASGEPKLREHEFVIGVSSEAHKAMLLEKDETLHIVVTGC